jgi:hypothetical protein
MRAAGIHTVQSPAEIGHTMAALIGETKSKSAAHKSSGGKKKKLVKKQAKTRK